MIFEILKQFSYLNDITKGRDGMPGLPGAKGERGCKNIWMLEDV